MRSPIRSLALAASALAVAFAPAAADMFNHKTILIGDKGAAFGGAFAGIADDATATYYNPAGMTQLRNVKLNVSAQVVQYQKQQIQIAEDNLIPYNSFNFSPSITSFSQRLGKWAYGFSIVTPVNDLFRGEMEMESPYRDTAAAAPCYDAPANAPCYARLNLSYSEVNKINLAGPSLALKFSDRISLGLTLYGIYLTQLEKTAFGGWEASYVGGTSQDSLSRFHEARVTREVGMTGMGLTGSFGILVRMDQGLSFGVNASPGSMVWVDRLEDQLYYDLSNILAGPDSARRVATEARTYYNFDHAKKHVEYTAPKLSVGASWQPVSWLVLAGQTDYLMGSLYTYQGLKADVESAKKRSGFESRAPVESTYTIEKQGVVNFSGGLSLRLTKAYTVALGGYTDFSQGPHDSRENSWNRRIDYYGATASVGIEKEYTESRFGFNASWGDAAITHFQWTQAEGGKPEILQEEVRPGEWEIVRERKGFDAFTFGIFLSSTLKI